MKLTKEEVKKAMGCCPTGNCKECPLKEYEGENCIGLLFSAALEIIKNLEKKEIPILSNEQAVALAKGKPSVGEQAVCNDNPEREGERVSLIDRLLDDVLFEINARIEYVLATAAREPYPKLTVFVSRGLLRILEVKHRGEVSIAYGKYDMPIGKIFGYDVRVFEGFEPSFYICEDKEQLIGRRY